MLRGVYIDLYCILPGLKIQQREWETIVMTAAVVQNCKFKSRDPTSVADQHQSHKGTGSVRLAGLPGKNVNPENKTNAATQSKDW